MKNCTIDYVGKDMPKNVPKMISIGSAVVPPQTHVTFLMTERQSNTYDDGSNDAVSFTELPFRGLVEIRIQLRLKPPKFSPSNEIFQQP